MKTTKALLYFALVTLLDGGQAFSQAPQTLLRMRMPDSLESVVIAGKPTVYYELHLTNLTSDSILLTRLQVMDAADSTVVFSIGEVELSKRYAGMGAPRQHRQSLLPAGDSAVIYLEVALPHDKTEGQLAHRLDFETLHYPGRQPGWVLGALTRWSGGLPLVLGPPLRDGPWVALYEPSWERGHRRVIYSVDGRARIPGRFAIDFIKLDKQGRYAPKDPNVVNNWYGYANEVLAVADGLVASVRDDFSESPTLSQHPVYPAEQATGNYVSLAIGNNRFVFYEHLRPGSIRVKAGQAVKKGAVIASVGFTGQTTGPHLHFHVADADSALGAEGVAFVLERFTVLGSYADFTTFGQQPWQPGLGSAQGTMARQRPVGNAVIRFPGHPSHSR